MGGGRVGRGSSCEQKVNALAEMLPTQTSLCQWRSFLVLERTLVAVIRAGRVKPSVHRVICSGQMCHWSLSRWWTPHRCACKPQHGAREPRAMCLNCVVWLLQISGRAQQLFKGSPEKKKLKGWNFVSIESPPSPCVQQYFSLFLKQIIFSWRMEIFCIFPVFLDGIQILLW